MTISAAQGIRSPSPLGTVTVVAYVLLTGNQWVSRWLVSGDLPEGGRWLVASLTTVRWRLTPERGNEWGFWAANLRTLFFVGLLIFGLARLARSARGGGVLAPVVGTSVLGACAATLLGNLVAAVFLGWPSYETSWEYSTPQGDEFSDLVLAPMTTAAFFGLLFGLVLTPVVARTRPRRVARRDHEPMSFW